jgi:hypothetical protein
VPDEQPFLMILTDSIRFTLGPAHGLAWCRGRPQTSIVLQDRSALDAVW